MAPKGVNSKVAAAKEKKAAVEASKKQQKDMEKEMKLEEEWSKGSKDSSKKEDELRKRQEQLQKKAERQKQLEEEEASLPQKNKTRQKGLDLSQLGAVEYGATGIDNAIDLLSLTKETGDKVERHPERRVKSAYAAFEEEQMPILKQENPTLRMTQLKQLLQKKWKKSPENPLNQAHVAFDATREEEKAAAKTLKEKKLQEFQK